MKKNDPIGVFDSGLGGLSVVQTIRQLLPNESIVYYGDSQNAPYGNKTVEQVLAYSEQIVQTLLDIPVKAIVIACNTATSAAADYLRKKYPETIIIGMEPAIKPALQQTNGKICVLATEMTLREAKFNRLIAQLAAADRTVKCPAPQLVEYVESDAAARADLTELLDQIVSTEKQDVSAVVLGCTHYLFVKQAIQDYFAEQVAIFDGNSGTVLHLKEKLIKNDLLNDQLTTAKLTIYNSAGRSMVARSYQILEQK